MLVDVRINASDKDLPVLSNLKINVGEFKFCGLLTISELQTKIMIENEASQAEHIAVGVVGTILIQLCTTLYYLIH